MINEIIREKTPALSVMMDASDLEKFATQVVGKTIAAIKLERESAQKSNDAGLITEAEARSLFGVSSQTLWRWRKRGYIDGVSVGGRIKFRKSDCEAIINGKRR